MTRPHNSCTGCIHWRGANGSKEERLCNYYIDTLQLRHESSEDCTHWTGEKKAVKRKERPDFEKRYRELYDLGRSDADIARATGRSESSVLQWRRRNGLAAQGVPGRKTERMDKL
jgi:hypothetical protein